MKSKTATKDRAAKRVDNFSVFLKTVSEQKSKRRRVVKQDGGKSVDNFSVFLKTVSKRNSKSLMPF